MTADELHACLHAAPAVVRDMVVMLLQLDDDQRTAIETMEKYGGVEIHWDTAHMSFYPRRKLLTRKRETLQVVGTT